MTRILFATLLLCSPLHATTISIMGSDMQWQGFAPPDANQYMYVAEMEFSEDFEVIEIDLRTSSSWGSTVEQADWIQIDEATRRSYLGPEIRVSLLGGDFMAASLDAANFWDLVAEVQVEWFEPSVSTNYDTALTARGAPHSIPEPVGQVLALIGAAFLSWMARVRQ